MDLLDEIIAFCTAHGMSESQFGTLALKDKNLVPQMKGEKGNRPRRLWPDTEAAVRHFMVTYRPQDEAA